MGYPTQQQKVDYLFKKIGFTKTKTGVAEDQTSGFSGDTKKAPPNEAIASPLVVPSASLWSDSSLIPTTPPTSNTAYVGIYTAANAYRMTVDSTVANERTFIARQTFGDSSSAIQGDWIDTQFGADYLVKVYMGNPSTGTPGVAYTNLSAAGTSGKDDVWFFDYSSGVLNFNGADLDGQLAGISTDNVYLVGYRYTGAKGANAPAGIGTFRDLVVHNNFKVGGISTFSGLIDANGLIEGIAGQNKIPSLYANYSDLPNAGTYHGMFAHVHASAKGYFAHAGGWFELVNKEATGIVGTGTERYNIGSLNVTGISTLGNIGISTGRITGPSVTYIDPATVGAAGTVVILGNLQVEGTQTTVNSSVMTVTDKNIEIAKGAANNAAVDGAGITVDAGSNADKTWQWLNATSSWTSSEHIRIPDNKVFGFASDTNTHIGRPSAYTLAFTTDNTERVRIDSNGHVSIGLGVNALHNNYVTIPRKSGDDSPIRLISLRNDIAAADLDFVKSRSTSYGSYAATQNDDIVMDIASYIDTGSAYSHRGAYRSIFDTANGGVHYTWSSGASIEEKVRFTSAGLVGIGTITPTSNLHVANYSGDATIEIESGNSASSILRFGDTDNNDVGQIKYDHSDNSLGLYTTNTNERVRIDSSGNTNIVGILTASNFDYTTNDNIRIGAGAAHTTTAQKIIAIGEGALQNVTTSGIVALGYNAGNSQTSGSDNIYIGNYAGEKNVDKNANTFVGDISGQYVTSHSNTAVGFAALRNINGGGQATHGNNSAFGRDSMQQITTGSNNAAFGNGSLMYVATGQANAAFGYNALRDSTGQYNTGVGRYVGFGLTTGNRNTILGAWFSGNQLTTGSNNTLLGYNATPTSTTVNNEITLGDTNVTKFRIPGIGVTLTDGIITIPTPVIDIDGDVTVGGNFKVVGVSTFQDNVVINKDKDLIFDRFGTTKTRITYNDTLVVTQIKNVSEGLEIGYRPTHLMWLTNRVLSTKLGGVNITGDTETDTLNVSGNSTFTGDAAFNGTISVGSTTGTDGYYLKTTGIGVTWAAFPSSRTTSTQTATAGQTTFNFSYNVGFVDVFVNGVKLPSSEFTASNGSTIVLDDAAFLNDTVEFVSYNTVPNSSAGAQNLNGLADVTITGTPVTGDTLQHDGSKFVNDYTITSTKTSTSQASIHSLAIATYRSVEYTVQITEGTKYHVTKILAIHDGTNATFNEYGTLTTHSSLATFALDINSGNMRLLATPTSSNSTVFKVKFNTIKV